MGFFNRRRYEPDFVANLLYCAMRVMHDCLPDYIRDARLNVSEQLRADLGIKLLPIAFSRGFLDTIEDPRMEKTFNVSYEGYFENLPNRNEEVAWTSYVVEAREVRAVDTAYREKFVGYAPQHFRLGQTVEMDTLRRVLSLVRNRRYLEDTFVAMELNAKTQAGRKEALTRVFTTLGESFTHQILDPLHTVEDPTGERFRASVGLSAVLIGKGFFEANDMFGSL